MRQRPFGIAGDWHGPPAPRPGTASRVAVRGQSPCTGLVLDFGMIPGPRRPDHAHHRLTAGMNVDVLHRHLLWPLPRWRLRRKRTKFKANALRQ
jgi:hypothetical protein